MINIDSYYTKIALLRLFSGFLMVSTVLGTLFFWGSLKPITIYSTIIEFIYFLFFTCASNNIIFSSKGKFVNYLFCIALSCRFIYEAFYPREYITYEMFIESQIHLILAAVLWWILIRKVIANKVAPTENKP
jgi:hypothetical protein